MSRASGPMDAEAMKNYLDPDDAEDEGDLLLKNQEEDDED